MSICVRELADRAEALSTLNATLDSELLHDNSRDVAYYHRRPSLSVPGPRHTLWQNGRRSHRFCPRVCKLKKLATDMQYGTILPCTSRYDDIAHSIFVSLPRSRFAAANKRILIIKRIAACDKRMRLLTSLYGTISQNPQNAVIIEIHW